MQEQRTCGYCGARLVRRTHEPSGPFARRIHCNRACSGSARAREWVDQDGPPWRQGANGCWIWERTTWSNGYGLIHVGATSMGAHRWVYERFVGPIPDGMEIDHVRARGCQSKACVNPDHLEVVKSAENIRRLPRCKLTVAQVQRIRARYAAGGIRQIDLANEFGVSRPAISLIVNGHNWKD